MYDTIMHECEREPWYNRLITIKKTCLDNFDPLRPHFYRVKLGFTGVYIIFLISAQNIDCWYSLEPPRRVPTIYVLSRNVKKYQNVLSEIFHFLVVKLSVYLNRHVFVMICMHVDHLHREIFHAKC